MIPEIHAAQFDAEVTRSDRPVLVDFFSLTCSPCTEMLPILGEIAQERAEKLKIVKFDAAKDPAFASRFRISSVPNFILFQNGTPNGQRAGRAPKRELLEWLDSTVG
jgi:thioredoxin 1